MNGVRPLSSEALTLLVHERAIVPQSPAVRTRVATRARAALVARGAYAPIHATATPRARWFVAAALVCVGGVAVGATTYEVRARWERAHERPTPFPSERTAPPSRPEQPAMPEHAAADTTVRELAPMASRRSKAEVARAELLLVRRARAAVAREDFTTASALLAEHGKRFREGRLVEEREALRVRTLVGLGRMEEARRGAVAFEARFPHSVLLSSVTRMPRS